MLFTQRHIGTTDSDRVSMLNELGFSSIDELIEKTIPNKIRLKTGLEFSKTISESKWLANIKRISQKTALPRFGHPSFKGLFYRRSKASHCPDSPATSKIYES